MESLVELKRNLWGIFNKNKSLVNSTVNPRNEVTEIEEGSNRLAKTTLVYYDITLSKTKYITMPNYVNYFVQDRAYVQYNCTLFDK